MAGVVLAIQIHHFVVVLLLFSCLSVSFWYMVANETNIHAKNNFLHRPRINRVADFPAALRGLSQASNIIDGKQYPHHPVMLQVPVQEYTMEPNYIVELNGLKIPAEYDCDIFNVNGTHWGNHAYFWEVPTRWSACWMHYAAVQSGWRTETPSLPLVDDEYNEQVAVYQSVLRSKPGEHYNVAEFGARWGTWGTRAVAFLSKLRPHAAYNLYLVEANQAGCEGVKAVTAKNNISYRLECGYATAEGFTRWAGALGHIDLVDFDIQGAERDLIPKLIETLDAKVYRVVIGTHSPQIHRQMQVLFSHWIQIWDVPVQHNKPCMWKYLRGNYIPNNPDRFRWDKLLNEGCFHTTPRGPVAHADGELILDNPRFVDRSKALSVSDTELVIDGLLDVPQDVPSDHSKHNRDSAFDDPDQPLEFFGNVPTSKKASVFDMPFRASSRMVSGKYA